MCLHLCRIFPLVHKDDLQGQISHGFILFRWAIKGEMKHFYPQTFNSKHFKKLQLQLIIMNDIDLTPALKRSSVFKSESLFVNLSAKICAPQDKMNGNEIELSVLCFLAFPLIIINK